MRANTSSKARGSTRQRMFQIVAHPRSNHGLINKVKTRDILRAWKTIIAGRTPSLSIEITKECPLNCPGCYAYGEEHLGGDVVLRRVSDYQGPELVARVLELVDAQ